MVAAFQSPSTIALVVGLVVALKGVVGLFYPEGWERLLSGLRVRRGPLTAKRLRNERFVNASFVGIGVGIGCSSIVAPAAVIVITTAVGLCSAEVTWYLFRIDALE